MRTHCRSNVQMLTSTPCTSGNAENQMCCSMLYFCDLHVSRQSRDFPVFEGTARWGMSTTLQGHSNPVANCNGVTFSKLFPKTALVEMERQSLMMCRRSTHLACRFARGVLSSSTSCGMMLMYPELSLRNISNSFQRNRSSVRVFFSLLQISHPLRMSSIAKRQNTPWGIKVYKEVVPPMIV